MIGGEHSLLEPHEGRVYAYAGPTGFAKIQNTAPPFLSCTFVRRLKNQRSCQNSTVAGWPCWYRIPRIGGSMASTSKHEYAMCFRIRCIPLLLVLSTAACTSPQDKKLTSENIEAIRKTKELTGEEVQMLQGYVMRTGMARALSGADTSQLLDSTKTIRSAIEEQRKWIHDDSVRTATEKAEADIALKRYEQEVARLRAIVTVTPVRKGFSEADYQSYITFQMVSKNNGEKALSGFKGRIRVTDMFGDLISRLEIKEDDPLAPGAERVFRTAYGYNQFMDRDTKLRFTSYEKMKFVWEPEIIIFADGTQLTVPPPPSP